MFVVDWLRHQTDKDGGHQCEREEEDGEVEIVEVLDNGRPVILHAVGAERGREGELEDEARTAD